MTPKRIILDASAPDSFNSVVNSDINGLTVDIIPIMESVDGDDEIAPRNVRLYEAVVIGTTGFPEARGYGHIEADAIVNALERRAELH
jgi:hypothetical protein